MSDGGQYEIGYLLRQAPGRLRNCVQALFDQTGEFTKANSGMKFAAFPQTAQQRERNCRFFTIHCQLSLGSDTASSRSQPSCSNLIDWMPTVLVVPASKSGSD